MTLTCPFCLEEREPEWEVCRRCDEPLTPEAEQQLAPPHLVQRGLDLLKGKRWAHESVMLALIGPFVCWIIFPPLAISRGIEARKLYRRHGEEPPISSIVGIVLGAIGLAACCFFVFPM